MDKDELTLAGFLKKELQGNHVATPLSNLLCGIANICSGIASLTAKGALADITGRLESQNIQGETQMQLDVLTNELFINGLVEGGLVAGLASEEEDGVLVFPDAKEAQFLVVFDPLDGSSNVPVNVSVGSIFSVLKSPEGRCPEEADFLQSGSQQIAAGYALYGPVTMLVLSVGKGTHGFTLDPESKTFILTHQSMQVAQKTSEFAINASNERFWDLPTVRYVNECKAGIEGKRERNFNMRWVASMVADVHRILLRGGIYLYPKDNKKPPKEGRLRLMYEANPMSMLIEQAGGKGSTGKQRILDVLPQHIHQRIPVIIGTTEEVNLVERYTSAYESGNVNMGYSPLFGERSLFRKEQ
jgi:fructose-1,6-bisphosphatase I / sedoheptulose-1,7-bisphosphatase